MLSTLILALAAVQFPGGVAADLAKSIATATNSSVLIESGASHRFDAFEYEPSNLDEMARAITKATELKRAAGIENAFYQPGLPLTHFQLNAVRQGFDPGARRSSSFDTPDQKSLTNGRVTLHSRSGVAFRAQDFGKLATSKPIAVDPFFNDLSLNAWVTDMPEREFLTLLAKTIGGTVKATKDQFQIVPNGQEVQRRALATLDQVKKGKNYAKVSPTDKAELGLSYAVIAASSPTQVAALVSEDMPVRLEITPSIRSAAVAYLQALMEAPPTSSISYEPPAPPNRTPPAAERFRSLDRRILGIATMGKGFRVSLELATVGEFGRPGPSIRVP